MHQLQQGLCPWAPASGPGPAYLVLLLINQLVALNSEPASGGGGNRVVDVGGIGTSSGQGQRRGCALCPEGLC